LAWREAFTLENEPSEPAHVSTEDRAEYDACGHVLGVKAQDWRHKQADAKQCTQHCRDEKQDAVAKLTEHTLSGSLRWERRNRAPRFLILERIPGGEPFAGAAIAEWGSPDGKLFAMVFSPESRTTGIHTIVLEEKHKNAIRRLKIPLPKKVE
jgi:hypothetical protein